MYLLYILIFVIPIIAGIWLAKSEKDEKLFAFFVGGGVAFIAAAVFGLLLYGILCITTPSEEVYERNKIELYTLKDKLVTEGNMGLFSGYIEGQMYYYYYRKVGDRYVLGKVKAENTDIYEIDGETAYLEKVWSGTKRPVVFWIFFGDSDMKPEFELHSQILYIPKNTVIKQYKLNLED